MSDNSAAARLLLQNKAWSAQMRAKDPEFFARLAHTQEPKICWIGCSDSRLPPDAITGTRPGSIFVHRNIANLVIDTDVNLASVLQYAVNVLKVEHIIVCGHHGCGGIHAAMTDADYGTLNLWLRSIKETYGKHFDELTAIDDQATRENRLSELSVVAQVHNLARTAVIQRAWAERDGPWLHGWVYDVRDGILVEHFDMAPGTALPPPFSFNAADRRHH